MQAPSLYFYTSNYNVLIQDQYTECDDNIPCFGNHTECDYYDGFCKCKQGYKFLHDFKNCIECPGYNYACNDDCCANNIPGISCIKGICSCEDPHSPFCPNPQTGVFVTASQIALSAALIMGIAALAMVIYRLCTKPKYPTARQRAEMRIRDIDSIDSESFGHIRTSLSSMQISVFSRLRDRPPPYQNEQLPSTVSSLPSTITIPNNENPPSYNNSRDTVTHLPPPYAEIVLNPSGYLNQSFESNESNLLDVNNETISETKDDHNQPNESIDNNNNINNSSNIK